MLENDRAVRRERIVLLIWLAASGACVAEPLPAVESPEPTLRRLTAAQYRSAVTQLLGPQILLPAQLEPDRRREGLFAVGAAQTSISPLGVEQYAAAAAYVASQLFEGRGGENAGSNGRIEAANVVLLPGAQSVNRKVRAKKR